MQKNLFHITTSKNAFLILALILVSCKHEPFKYVKQPDPVVADNYPEDISRIIINKCATAGCHNGPSHALAGNLLLDSWEHLFDGGNTGAAVVPFSPENSPLLYFINSFPDMGPVPADHMKMPLNQPPLSRDEYLTIRNWIAAGAPDKAGNIAFASNANTRQKIYLAHQGCDYITVIDAEKNVIMRCVPTGKEITIETAYDLKISPDDHAYISFWANQYILKMNCASDSLVDDIDIGSPNSKMLYIAPDSRNLLLTNIFSASLMRIDVPTKQVMANYGSGSISSPEAIAANPAFDTFYVTEQFGNTVVKLTASGVAKKISIDGNAANTNASGSNPHNIQMTPDGSRYFVTCAGSNEVRVMDAHADTLIKVMSVGKVPQGLAISRTSPYIFVSCTEDDATLPIFKGSVYIINYNTYEVVRKINDRFYLPRAMAVDDRSKKLFVFSRNIDPNGPEPHHNSATCNGRSGYYSVYDFEKLEPVNNRRYEVTIDPFAADTRFK